MARASDDDWEWRDYSLLPHLYVHGELQQPVGFVWLRELVSEKKAQKLRKKKGRK